MIMKIFIGILLLGMVIAEQTIRCPLPDVTPQGGIYRLVNNTNRVGGMAKLRCRGGKREGDNPYIICKEDGEWSAPEAHCILPEVQEKDCIAQPDAGPCKASQPRFYYDPAEESCKGFVYGGCGGNGNNFQTEEECKTTCADLLSKSRTACTEDKEVGPCKAAFPRFFFNSETGQCERFTYGGCMGNSNNFNSKEDCEAVCIN